MSKMWKIALVGAAILGLSTSSCVDENASLVMLGSTIGSGSVEQSQEEGAEPIARCTTFPTEFDEPEVWSRVIIDLEMIGDSGQPAVGEVGRGASNYFEFRALFENRLEDSRNVGAVSGGSGGGFEGLKLDKNDIIVTSATVEFAAEENTIAVGGQAIEFEGMVRERLSSMLVQSGGGAANMGVPLLNGSQEVDIFDQFMESAVQADLDPSERITFVVNIQLHGHTLGGTEVESNIYPYPVEVCRGCGFTTPLCLPG